MNNTPAETTALAMAPRQGFDLSPQSFEQALTFSQYLADSDLVPKDFKGKAGNCLIAVQWGAELGLKPMQAMQNLAIINGRPSLWGDAVLALVRASSLCEYVMETDDGHTATCRVKRRGDPAEQIRTFSMDDAKAAGLAGKQGPWAQYPKRMRQMRARAFALRDVFPDVLRGLPVAEELMDTPPEKFMGMAETVKPETQETKTYAEEDFAKNLPAWVKAVATGKKTRDALVDTVQTKGHLTPEQLQRLDAAITAAAPAPDQATGEIVMTYAQVAQRMTDAKNLDKLAEAASLISTVADEGQRKELTAIYDRRATELNA